ncbi:MAG: poly-gamma-glutamate synthase PgsB [Bacteroidales bacterium]|nr:poly-gamma-glutamate synthase PgsB [Bacteroidales bacterium]
MYSFYILLFMIFVAAIVGLVEYRRHQKRIYSIPIRIHINGTRGKSSVTRLIGAALREAGISSITKVTGTFPRLILQDGTETYIHRKSDPNIIEQLSIVKYAARQKVKALVMECMALQPQYQTITEKHMIHSNIGVITNIRLDHVDVMGHTLTEIAQTLGRTIPHKQHLFTAENVTTDQLERMAKRKKSAIHFTNSDIVTKDDMKGFGYIEHRENVALALEVCRFLKIDRETALQGMYKAEPDAGVLKCYNVDAFGKKLSFYNAFAANDPDSSLMIWNMIREEIGFDGIRIILLNTRQDRLDRAKQLAELTGSRLSSETDYVILMGQSTEVVEHLTIGFGLPRKKVVNLGWTTPDKIFEKVLALTPGQSTIVAIGNMGGRGAETVEYFKHRSINHYG